MTLVLVFCLFGQICFQKQKQRTSVMMKIQTEPVFILISIEFGLSQFLLFCFLYVLVYVEYRSS